MFMKIYFAGSIRGGRNDFESYMELIRHIQKHGKVLTEHVGYDDVEESERKLTDKEIHDRDLEWLEQADCVIAEVTQPSLGVGYEIALAAEKGKKILCLFRERDEKRLSAMISGCGKLRAEIYKTIEEAKEKIDNFLTS